MKRMDEAEDPLDTRIRETLQEGPPPETEQMLRERLHAFRGQLAMSGTSFLVGGGWLRRIGRVATPLATAAMVLLIGWVVFAGMSRPTWAQVAERFEAAPFITAAVYVKENALAEPVQIELWMGQGSRMRMRAGREMLFGEQGHLVETVSIGADTAPRPDLRFARNMIDQVILTMGEAGVFSLEAIIAAIPVKGVMTQPMENQLVQVAGDLIVFDITIENSYDWIRIWAYRDSQLPARLVYWAPESGESIDVVFSYGEMPDASFFDPEIYRASLTPDGHPSDQAYALLKDPGGRPLTPKDIETPNP